MASQMAHVKDTAIIQLKPSAPSIFFENLSKNPEENKCCMQLRGEDTAVGKSLSQYLDMIWSYSTVSLFIS